MDLYYMLGSAPCRGVLLTARALGLEPNLKVLDLQKGEHLKPEFLSINPQHCIPTLVDGDLALWEGKAIAAYLANRYGKDDALYPKDPKARALVDRLLYFDMGTLYHRFGEYVYPVLFRKQTPDPEKLTKLVEALGWVESFLKEDGYLAGSSPTIADHAIIATITSIEAGGIPLSAHPKLVSWLTRCKATMPGFDENQKGAKMFGDYIIPAFEAHKA